MPRPIHLLINPASGNCNLRCAYCRSEINQKFIPHPKVLRY